MSKKTKAELLHDVENLQNECDALKGKVFQMESDLYRLREEKKEASQEAEMHKTKRISLMNDASRLQQIDFGVGMLRYEVHKGSAIMLTELMQTLKDAALIVPLTTLVQHMQKVQGFPVL